MSTLVNHVHKVQRNKKDKSHRYKKIEKEGKLDQRRRRLAKHENGFAINVNVHG